MYIVDDQDRVVPYKDVPAQSAGASMPVVIADDVQLLAIYEAGPTGDERVALKFDRPIAHYFGPPNDEALSGHPLVRRGLAPYGQFEVVTSSWIRSLERMNRVHPTHSPARFAKLRHFIFTFHDTTFECVAEGVSVAARVPNNTDGMEAIRKLLVDLDWPLFSRSLAVSQQDR